MREGLESDIWIEIYDELLFFKSFDVDPEKNQVQIQNPSEN
jgi:hypothetical protein